MCAVDTVLAVILQVPLHEPLRADFHRRRRTVAHVTRLASVYTIRFAAAVFVLHVFQKKSKSGVETPKPDMARIVERLKYAARLAKEM